jgi:hypothetical protein
MTPEMKYVRIGKFIFGTCRHDGNITDVYSWMEAELGIAHPNRGDDRAIASLQAAYFAKYVSDEQFDESHQRFMKMMVLRSA